MSTLTRAGNPKVTTWRLKLHHRRSRCSIINILEWNHAVENLHAGEDIVRGIIVA